MNGKIIEKIDITKYPVKKLVAIPLIILLIALALLTYTQLSVDSPVRMGMDFKGGTWVKVGTDETREEVNAKFSAFPVTLVASTGVGNEKRIEFDMTGGSQEYDRLIDMLNTEYGVGTYRIESISARFGKQYQTQALWAVAIAFILMAVVVFITFRTFVPPLAVIFSAFSDIVIAVACMDLIGMELSLGTVAALLMLIGYSVDSDILLTTNLLRKKGELNEKLRNTMRTGITMTSTTISAIFAMFVVSFYIDIPILKDISIVLLFGLAVDLMNTWLFNAGVLRWYIERKERKKYVRRDVGKAKKKR
ncbi:MAG: protein translocase subunit SecF [Euryarchaeota archaeon]|nr:protein translocase subunit SecF [Euryarchaeota archaeon]